MCVYVCVYVCVYMCVCVDLCLKRKHMFTGGSLRASPQGCDRLLRGGGGGGVLG